jgi:hypothetical protein
MTPPLYRPFSSRRLPYTDQQMYPGVPNENSSFHNNSRMSLGNRLLEKLQNA